MHGHKHSSESRSRGLVALVSSMYNNRRILKRFYESPSEMGEIAPFSPSTIHALTRPLRRLVAAQLLCKVQGEKSCGSLRVLEIGAGDGHLTQSICDLLEVFDKTTVVDVKFDVVEFDETARDKLQSIQSGCRFMSLHIVDYTKFEGKHKYDVIISTLPEQTMPYDVLNAALNKMVKEVKPGGHVMRVQYVTKLTWLSSFLPKKRVDELIKVMALKKQFDYVHKVRHSLIWNNIPPTYVLTLLKS